MSPTLVVVSLAVGAALFAYWALAPRQAPAEAGAPRRLDTAKALTPLMAMLQRDITLARVNISPALFLIACIASAAGGYLLGGLLRNQFLALLGLGLFFLPVVVLRKVAGYRHNQIDAAVGQALLQFAKIAAVRHHPFLVVQDSLPALPPIIRGEFEQAVADYQANMPFEDALTALAARCGDNFYLYQFAELARATLHTGADLAKGCERLLGRYDLVHELRGEQRADSAPYVWACWIIFVTGLVPIPYWAIFAPEKLRHFTENSGVSLFLGWTVAFGLLSIALPYLFGLED